MTQQLTGKVALVTGASSGIGYAAALALAEAGADVAVAGRRVERLEELSRAITAMGRRAIQFVGDVGEEATANGMVAGTIEQLGRIDILVNSAGVTEVGLFEDTDLDEWRRVLDANLWGCIYTCKAAFPHMRGQGSGDIVNISSTAGRRAAGMSVAYSASKFGLTGMTEALRQEGGAVGVRVSVIEPGATRTEVYAPMPNAQHREAIREHVNKPGAMEAQDIAAAILFVVTQPARVNISEILIRPTIDVMAM